MEPQSSQSARQQVTELHAAAAVHEPDVDVSRIPPGRPTPSDQDLVQREAASHEDLARITKGFRKLTDHRPVAGQAQLFCRSARAFEKRPKRAAPALPAFDESPELLADRREGLQRRRPLHELHHLKPKVRLHSGIPALSKPSRAFLSLRTARLEIVTPLLTLARGSQSGAFL